MTREQLDALARRYLSARFDEIEERLATETHPGAREVISSELNDRAHELDAALTFGDSSPTVDRARKLIPGEDELTQLKLARRLIEVELEACVAEIAALGGRRLVMPSLASHAAASEEPKETPRFSEVVELFAEDKLAQNAWTARSEAQNRAILAVVCELLGDPGIGDVTKDDIRTRSRSCIATLSAGAWCCVCWGKLWRMPARRFRCLAWAHDELIAARPRQVYLASTVRTAPACSIRRHRATRLRSRPAPESRNGFHHAAARVDQWYPADDPAA